LCVNIEYLNDWCLDMAITKGLNHLSSLVSQCYQIGNFFVKCMELEQSGMPHGSYKIYAGAIRGWCKKARNTQRICWHSNLNKLAW
jgi:hypothetical protein